MLRVTRVVSCALFLATILGATTTFAGLATGVEDQDDTSIFYWENDVFSKNDRYYTNGLKLIWVSGPLSDYTEDKRLPAWSSKPIRSMPVINTPTTTKHVAFLIGQQMFTPQDVENPDLIVDDRPYAGWTYAGIALHSKSASVLDSFELDIGMVGPESYARDVQEKVHDLVDSARAEGWDHQLNNEVGVVLVYERKWQLWQLGLGNTNVVDFIPHLGMALGNVHTYANAGGEIRLGINLPEDFGTALLPQKLPGLRTVYDVPSPPAYEGKMI